MASVYEISGCWRGDRTVAELASCELSVNLAACDVVTGATNDAGL